MKSLVRWCGFAALMALAAVIPTRAQTYPDNCMEINASLKSDIPTYDSTNFYIATETVTWTWTCYNSNSGTSTNGPNAVTAFGEGGVQTSNCGGASTKGIRPIRLRPVNKPRAVWGDALYGSST
jgi:hypothetical protein